MNDATAAGDGLNFDLPDEIRMLKDTVRKFVDREMIPIERETRDGHKLKPPMARIARIPARTKGPVRLRSRAGNLENRFAFVTPSKRTRKVRTGRSMFFNRCSPASSKFVSILSRIC